MPLPEPRSCPACDARGSRSIGEKNGFEIQRCPSCSTLFTAELPPPSAGHDYDAYYHEGNLQVPGFVRTRLDEVVAGFEPERRTGRWLDVGCGAGTLLEAVRGRGWDAVGTEVSMSGAEAVRAKGFEVHAGELQELELEHESFDVLSLVEVVEHVPAPRQLLADARALLRPGGVLYVTTPHGRGISARLLGTSWSVVIPPEHLQLFSLAGLKSAAAGAGLDTVRLRTQAVNPSELLSALRRNRAPVTAGARVESSYRLNEALSGSARGKAVKSLVNSALWATRLGDSIRFVARRSG